MDSPGRWWHGACDKGWGKGVVEIHSGNGGGDGGEGREWPGLRLEQRERGGDRKRKACAIDGRARGRHGQVPCTGRACTFGRNLNPNVGREWIESRQKTDDSPFAAAR